MNLKEGAEVFLREALSGPLLMFAPMLVLFGAKKYIGKSTFTNSSLINRLGNTLTNTVKNESHTSTTNLRNAFYKNSIKSAVQQTTNIADKSVENITMRTRWFIDKNIPLFKGEDRNYVEKLFNFESKE